MMELLENATDSEDELPEGWEERVTSEGRVYYANHKDKSTQWEHPITNKCKKLSGELPYGWQRKILDDGTIVFADHINQQLSYTDPRLAFAKSNSIRINFQQQHQATASNNQINSNNSSSSKNPQQQKTMTYFSPDTNALDLLKERDLSNFRAVVTGGSSGVGFEIARALAFTGCYVVLACRDMQKGKNVFEQLTKQRTDLRLELMELDLASLRSVKEFAEKYKAKYDSLNMLFLNAATFETEHKLTVDNLEMMFQVNYLAQFYLTRLLIDTLMNTIDSRLIVISCESHHGGNLTKFDISANQLNISRNNFNFLQSYCNSKLCTLLFAKEMNRRLNKMSPTNLTCKCCHPGNLLPTTLFSKWAPVRCLSIFTQKFTKTLAQAAATPIYLATVQQQHLSKENVYYSNFNECTGSTEANDSILAYRIWEISENMLIDRTSEFDDTLRIGDKFSSFTKDIVTPQQSPSAQVATASSSAAATSFEMPGLKIVLDGQHNFQVIASS